MLKNNQILNVLVSRNLEEYKTASIEVSEKPNVFEALFRVLCEKRIGNDYSVALSAFNAICAELKYDNAHLVKILNDAGAIDDIYVFSKCLSDLSDSKIEGLSFLTEVNKGVL